MSRLRQPNFFYPTYSVSRCLIAVVLLLFTTPLKAKTAAVSKPFVLRVGETVRIDNQELALTFEGVTRDNRCPKDVRCIVAGSATVLVIAKTLTNPTTEMIFDVPPSGRASRSVGGYTITVTEVNPCARSSQRIRPEDYLITVLIKRDTGE